MTNPTAAETPGPFQPGEWAADLAACTASFTVRNFGLRFVTGKIPLTRASVTVNRSGQPISIRAELDPRGIDTGNRRRDSDLRGARFLAASRWPAITYQASAVQASGQAGRSTERSPSRTPTAPSGLTSAARTCRTIRQLQSTCARPHASTAARPV